MNSDKFDRVVLDLLYGELDELTTAAARRHMEQSARAREIYAHLKATRQLGVLPAHVPPSDFELTLMARERRALAELPLVHRLGRIVSMLAGYAMRPQLVMGALLLLMLGSSLMFLRARPGQHAAMQVTERGAPEADVDLVLPLTPAPASPVVADPTIFQPPATAPAQSSASAFQPPSTTARPAPPAQPSAVARDAGAEGLEPFDQAVNLYRAGQYAEARMHFERISRGGGQRAAEAALYAAQATRNISGCTLAVSRFERVRARFPGSGFAYEASWRAAKCLQQLGDVEAARQTYESLLQVAAYADRARQALASSGAPAPSGSSSALPPIALHDPPPTPSVPDTPPEPDRDELEPESAPLEPKQPAAGASDGELTRARQAHRARSADAGSSSTAGP